jgi:hypothetical protein
MLKRTNYIENHFFFGLSVDERKLPTKNPKTKGTNSVYLAFERIFSGSPFRRSARHKMTNFDASVKKAKKYKNKKKRVASDYRNVLLRTALKRMKMKKSLYNQPVSIFCV